MTNKSRSIGIIGAGVAGLSAAIALKLAGHDITLYEAAPELVEIGAGLQLSPNGTRLLAQLGVGLHAAVEPDGVELRDGLTGRRIVFTAFGQTARDRWGAPYVHIARSDLQLALLNRATELRVEPQLSQKIDDLTMLDHDFIVLADGVNSNLRTRFLGDNKLDTGVIAYRAAMPVDNLTKPPEKRAIIWRGSGMHAVTTRIGTDGQVVNFVGIIGNGRTIDGFNRFHPDIRAIIAASDDVQKWPLYTRAPQFFVDERVFLIGDAAHATLPSAAQGAVMAIEDAVVLAKALNHENPAAHYSSMRTNRVTRVMKTSQKNMEQFHRGQPIRTLENMGARMINTVYPAFFYNRLDWLYNYDAAADGF